MKIFISWSGAQSKAVAMKLRDWLPLVLHYVKPWVSASDIDAGKRWSTEVARELDQSSFGILCVTRENLNSPWILFEAGALAKSIGTGAVVPYLIDIDFGDLTGPLTQFQGNKAEELPTLEVVTAINNRSNETVPDERVRELFGLAWPKMLESISNAPKSSSTEPPKRPTEEVLEELVQLVRSMDQRMAQTRPKLHDEGSSVLARLPFGDVKNPRYISLSRLPPHIRAAVVKFLLEGDENVAIDHMMQFGFLSESATESVRRWSRDLESVHARLVEDDFSGAVKSLSDIAHLPLDRCEDYLRHFALVCNPPKEESSPPPA